jgi:hypothetical protein
MLELRRIDVDVVEPWYHVSIVKAKTVSTVGLHVRIITIDRVVLWLVGVLGGQRQVWHTNTSNHISILFELN